MKQNKIIYICLAIICIATSIKANAQYLDMKGVTIQVKSGAYIENGETISFAVHHIYNISFSDALLIHNIFDNEVIDKSQIYKLSNIDKYMDGSITIYKFDALSGVSGLTYKYEMKIDIDGKLKSLILTESGGEKTTYNGGISELRTYRQD